MRLRGDSWWDAGTKRAILIGARPDPRQQDRKKWDPLYLRLLNDPAFEPAQPGDVWRIRWVEGDPRRQTYRHDAPDDWPIGGYALWCPNEACDYGVHVWDHAMDCPAPFGACKYNRTSCWEWSGTPEDGTLTAHPSLWVKGGCGWHGFLRSGEMQSV